MILFQMADLGQASKSVEFPLHVSAAGTSSNTTGYISRRGYQIECDVAAEPMHAVVNSTLAEWHFNDVTVNNPSSDTWWECIQISCGEALRRCSGGA